jgi:hypothetical protein
MAPLIVVVFSALPEAAMPGAGAAARDGVLPELSGPELAHAATISAAATTAADASHPIRRRCRLCWGGYCPLAGLSRR